MKTFPDRRETSRNVNSLASETFKFFFFRIIQFITSFFPSMSDKNKCK